MGKSTWLQAARSARRAFSVVFELVACVGQLGLRHLILQAFVDALVLARVAADRFPSQCPPHRLAGCRKLCLV
jgi:hypothetical protein